MIKKWLTSKSRRINLTVDRVQLLRPFYMKYDGKAGYAQTYGHVHRKHVAISVNAGRGGKHRRVMKVTSNKNYQDFGGTCSMIDIKATRFVLENGELIVR